MEMRKLNAGDYDELLSLLNHTFANKYGRAMDFLNEQPKMWVRDDEHMQKHIGIFEDGRLAAVVGIYELHAMIGGEPITFATTGNVATLPEYEGRGYFTKIFDEIIAESLRLGVDVNRLGGARQRYGRYGYEPCGAIYKYTVTETNRRKAYKGALDIEFSEVLPTDSESLAFIDKISRRADTYIIRSSENGYRDVYLALSSKHSTPYIAHRGGEPIGYIAAYADNQFVGKSERGRHIAEIRSISPETTYDMIMCWQNFTGADVTVAFCPTMQKERALLEAVCENSTLQSPSHFRFNNIEKIAGALLRLKATREILPEGEVVIKINGYATYRFYNNGDGAGCEICDKAPDLTLDYPAAVRLIFGTYPSSVAGLSLTARAFFPLPLTWNTNDYT